MHIPSYSSSIFFELHKFNGSFYVDIFYKPFEDTEPTKLFIPNCDEKCPLNKIYELYRDIIPTEDFNTECRITQTQRNEENNFERKLKKKLLKTRDYLPVQIF